MQSLKISSAKTGTKKHNLSLKKLEKSLIGLQSNMLNYAFSLTSNKENAKDLSQETTLKVLGNLDKYYNNVNFKGWVLTIMYNIFVNNYRKTVLEKTILYRTDNLHLLNLPQTSVSNNPESDFAYKQLRAAMDRLDNEYKIPFSMLFSGYKYFEIAEKMGLPIGTIKSRIFLARKKLQKTLNGYK